jgi:hypothetical protein
MKFAAIALSAAAAVAAFIIPAAPPASAGPFGDNPLAWIAKRSTKGGEYDPPSGARSGLAPEVQGFGQRHFGVNSNDARRASIIVAPDPQHGEFQSVSLLFRDLVDEGAAHISVRGDDGRPLGRVDLARREARQDRREDRSERGGKGRRK